MSRIIYVSDFDMRGSGYFNISIPLCSGLIEKGHEVKVLGLGYKGDNHKFPFSIIPTKDFVEMAAMMKNLVSMWPFDVIMVALDIPMQEKVLILLGNKPPEVKYIGIMPIESDPLVIDWAMILAQMDKAFIISKFGTEEANKKGIDAEYFEVGIDSDSWKKRTEEEHLVLRKSFGIEEDEFVVLTVADNQERKNLWASFDVFSRFHKEHPKSKYILVTRGNSSVGWKLRTMANEMGFGKDYMEFERGINFKQLWSLYAMSDAFLLFSKAEGLGMPVMEAMSVGVPVIGTNCTGIKELLSEGRGFLVDADYVVTDPFGNAHRYWIDRDLAYKTLEYVYEHRPSTELAREFTEKRKWENSVNAVHDFLVKNETV